MSGKAGVSKGGGVKSITNFSRNGLKDWFVQRITAVILLLYVVLMVGFFIGAQNLDYEVWVDFMMSPVMQVANTLVLLSLLGHAWIGLWTIVTDYVKPVCIRFVVQFTLFLLLFIYLVWGLKVFWGL